MIIMTITVEKMNNRTNSSKTCVISSHDYWSHSFHFLNLFLCIFPLCCNLCKDFGKLLDASTLAYLNVDLAVTGLCMHACMCIIVIK